MEILTLKLPDYAKITSVNSTVEYTIVRYMAVNHDLLQSAKEVKSSGMLGRDVGGGRVGLIGRQTVIYSIKEVVIQSKC